MIMEADLQSRSSSIEFLTFHLGMAIAIMDTEMLIMLNINKLISKSGLELGIDSLIH